MLKVRVIKPFRRRGEIIQPNSILDVADEVLEKLVGLVEALPCDGASHPDPHHIIGEFLAKVDRFGRPWPRHFFDRLSSKDKVWLKENERQVDAAALTGDMGALDTLLNSRERFLLDRRGQRMGRS